MIWPVLHPIVRAEGIGRGLGRSQVADTPLATRWPYGAGLEIKVWCLWRSEFYGSILERSVTEMSPGFLISRQ